ncbi:hypothetical protein R3O67_28150 [Bacillus cereus]|uniref:hypothetical protein n=1 Tax=Bacillus cereus TaxID=1396 RepID=UPI003078C618
MKKNKILYIISTILIVAFIGLFFIYKDAKVEYANKDSHIQTETMEILDRLDKEGKGFIASYGKNIYVNTHKQVAEIPKDFVPHWVVMNGFPKGDISNMSNELPINTELYIDNNLKVIYVKNNSKYIVYEKYKVD